MNKLFLSLIGFTVLLSSCALEETEDLATLLVGTYSGKATDNFMSLNRQKVIITRISDDEIEITPEFSNSVNSVVRIKIVQDGNWIRHEKSATNLSFEAKASKNNIPLKFSTNVPLQTFEGKLMD